MFKRSVTTFPIESVRNHDWRTIVPVKDPSNTFHRWNFNTEEQQNCTSDRRGIKGNCFRIWNGGTFIQGANLEAGGPVTVRQGLIGFEVGFFFSTKQTKSGDTPPILGTERWCLWTQKCIDLITLSNFHRSGLWPFMKQKAKTTEAKHASLLRTPRCNFACFICDNGDVGRNVLVSRSFWKNFLLTQLCLERRKLCRYNYMSWGVWSLVLTSRLS